MSRSASSPRVVGLALAFVAAVLAAFLYVATNESASGSNFTSEQKARYLAEMKENLNGHPDRPRYDLVSEQVLLQEGVVACEWLSTQPKRPFPLPDELLRDRYFDQHPRAGRGWPFARGRTGLREELLTNSWGWLCGGIREDHQARWWNGDQDD